MWLERGIPFTIEDCSIALDRNATIADLWVEETFSRLGLGIVK